MDRLQQIRLNKTQRRIMPGVSKLAALLKRLLREVNYTAWNWLCYCLDIVKSKAAADSCFYRRILQIPPVSASVEVTNICNSQENLKAVNDERDVGQIPATTYFKGEDMDFIEATPLPTECRCCQETDCYNCDHASKRWTLSKKQELLLLRKLKEKAILRFKRQIEEIDYQIAMMEEAKR